MELKVEIEIGLSESTKEFITEMMLGVRPVVIPEMKEPVIHSALTADQPAQAVAAAAPVAENPAKGEKKAAKASKPAEPVESPAEPEQPAETAPVKGEPAVDYKKLRGEIKAYCSKRKAEGVNIPQLVFQFLGKKGAKFSEIPDEKLTEFKALVESAEVA